MGCWLSFPPSQVIIFYSHYIPTSACKSQRFHMVSTDSCDPTSLSPVIAAWCIKREQWNLTKAKKISHCQAQYHAGNKADDKEIPLGNKGVDQTHVEGSLITPITIPHGRLWDGNKVVYSNPKIDRKVGHLEIGIQCDPTPPGNISIFGGWLYSMYKWSTTIIATK